MDKKVLMEQVTLMNINFTLNKTADELKAYCQMLYPKFVEKGITNEMLIHAVDVFMDKTEGSNFNKLPSRGDFLTILNLKPKSIEDTAREQAQECISNVHRMRLRCLVQYDDPITNWVLENSFGGVSNFCWQLDETNKDKTKTEWVTKRFVEEYMTASLNDKKVLHPIRNTNRSLTSWDDILMIGDENVCIQNKNIAISQAKARKQLKNNIEKQLKIEGK